MPAKLKAGLEEFTQNAAQHSEAVTLLRERCAATDHPAIPSQDSPGRKASVGTKNCSFGDSEIV